MKEWKLNMDKRRQGIGVENRRNNDISIINIVWISTGFSKKGYSHENYWYEGMENEYG